MLKLSYQPLVGGSVVINLSFMDANGAFYVPVSVNYSILAQNDTLTTWQVVNSKYEESVTAASMISLALQGDDLEEVDDTTLKRKVVINWKYVLGGELISATDYVDFTLIKQPVIYPEATAATATTVYPEVSSILVTPAPSTATGTNPVIAITFSIPVTEDTAESAVKLYLLDSSGDLSTEQDIDYSFSAGDSVVTITPQSALTEGASYRVVIGTGLESYTGTYLQEEYTSDFTVASVDAGTVLLKSTTEINTAVAIAEGSSYIHDVNIVPTAVSTDSETLTVKGIDSDGTSYTLGTITGVLTLGTVYDLGISAYPTTEFVSFEVDTAQSDTTLRSVFTLVKS